MLSFLRGADPPRTNIATNNPIVFEDGRSSVQFHSRSSEYMMTHTIPPTTQDHGASLVQPPFHYHIYQTERFRVRAGTATFWRGIGSAPWITLSAEPGKPSTGQVGPGRYHKFENASKTQDLVIDVQLDPEDYEREQKFFRNFFGYLDDCRKLKVAPSLFQLLVFLHEADTPLGLPLPHERLGVWASRAFLIGMASCGRWLLGYKATYPEYYEDRKST
ncbi:hypothetical protein PV11_10140 [Exophiala sideris]|uniref:Cupin 2 conserved barrel domain-containing protein n=1 Tax=Exophiala sideris TaxID=1016849 RepID=A0A0D1VQS8_9EURO|nr:hypothetical protein PV11_10140 [Exophiala sideris]